jgi:hypothetical protein
MLVVWLFGQHKDSDCTWVFKVERWLLFGYSLERIALMAVFTSTVP